MKGRFQSTLLAFLAFGLVMGIYTAFVSRSLATGIVLGIISGAVFALLMLLLTVVFKRFRAFGLKDIKGWAPDEVEIRSGLANMMRHGLGEGGMLFLTNKRLRFCSHRAGVEVADHSFPLATIASVAPCRTLGLVPNGLLVQMSDGRSAQFVVDDRTAWHKAVTDQIASAQRPPDRR